LIIPALIPVALRGVKYRVMGADDLLKRNLFTGGSAAFVLPFIGIKADRHDHGSVTFRELKFNKNGGYENV